MAEAAGLADPSRLRWTVEAVDHESIIDTTGGLFDVRGYGHDGDAPAEWSCVVKALERSEGGECDPPDSWCYGDARQPSTRRTCLPRSLRLFGLRGRTP